MADAYTVLVIGTGFGKHYDRIISQINQDSQYPGVKVNKLIVTKTDLVEAQEFAAALVTKGIEIEIIGAQISKESDLDAIMNQYSPTFVAIAAQDKETGDNIHRTYAEIALKYDCTKAVLVEKPFMNANGDRRSLEAIMNLHSTARGRLGVELPHYFMGREMQKHEEISGLLKNAKELEFYWGTKGNNPNIIDDLALHPWSLLPDFYKLKSASYTHLSNDYTLVEAVYSYHDRDINVKMHLMHKDKNFNGIKIDNRNFVIVIDLLNNNNLVEIEERLSPRSETINSHAKGAPLIIVENPLKKHIYQALSGNIVCGYDIIYKSQEFLEMAHIKK